jgi:hypothetical protein
VTGSQWSWRFEYPDQGINSNQLWLPVDQQTLLHLSSTDVIHSFWVPEFRVKQDALPGGDEFVRDLRITPTEIGDYKVRCAELCGLQHAYMLAPVHVVSQADFDAWVSSMVGPAASPVERGQLKPMVVSPVTQWMEARASARPGRDCMNPRLHSRMAHPRPPMKRICANRYWIPAPVSFRVSPTPCLPTSHPI